MAKFTEFITRLEIRLQSPLPGNIAHQRLVPVTRKKFPSNPDLSKAIPSSVLILFYPIKDQPHLVFIQRPKYNGVHSGQMAFPGGKAETSDKSRLHTALRETGEEIGVKTDDIKVIGNLSDLYIPPSNFIVSPFVGYLNYMPVFIPEIKEVKEIFTVSFDELMDEQNFQARDVEALGLIYEVPCFYLQEKVIWGATSMIINELLEVVKGNR
jgi:8-oxo-dGTP pyrophosphatase MutT (NUDIX family)